MTKELYESAFIVSGNIMVISVQTLNKFLDSNVCIPKGENRHKYADVFHEAMEDTTKVIQFEDGHVGCDWTNLHLAEDRKHRIKPTEPVYEWLYYSRIGDTVWSTKEDAPMNMWCAEETKRIKQ